MAHTSAHEFAARPLPVRPVVKGEVQLGVVADAIFDQGLALADAELARQPWLSGETFAMGDIPLGAFAYAWFEMPIQRPALPYLADWYARLQARPAYRKGVMTPLT